MFILERLGFKSFDELRGKKILDIGSYSAEFALGAREKGIEIICSDIKEECQKAGLAQGLNYILANANNLPFKDSSLDLVLSHASAPTVLSKKEDIIKILQEVKRVLKEDGEFRFGPTYLGKDIFLDNELFTAEEKKILNVKQKIERIREASLKFLQNYDPNITETLLSYEGRIPKLYYTMKKI